MLSALCRAANQSSPVKCPPIYVSPNGTNILDRWPFAIWSVDQGKVLISRTCIIVTSYEERLSVDEYTTTPALPTRHKSLSILLYPARKTTHCGRATSTPSSCIKWWLCIFWGRVWHLVAFALQCLKILYSSVWKTEGKKDLFQMTWTCPIDISSPKVPRCQLLYTLNDTFIYRHQFYKSVFLHLLPSKAWRGYNFMDYVSIVVQINLPRKSPFIGAYYCSEYKSPSLDWCILIIL